MGTSKEKVDEQAQEFLEYLWEEGEGLSLAADTLSSIQHFQPSMKKRLPGSWWRLVELLRGYFHQRSPQVALALGVGFRALLRASELLSLQSRDIVLTPGSVSNIFYLGETKTGHRNLHAGTVTFQDSQLVHLLRLWQLTSRPTQFLVPWSQAQFRTGWNKAMADLGLVEYGFKPYSLRRGGATELYLTTHNSGYITRQGQWTNERTTRVYIQDSLALLTELTYRPTKMHDRFLTAWKEVCNQCCVEPRRKTIKRGRGR